MKLMVFILNKVEALEPLLTSFADHGIGGATILSSTGMARALHAYDDDSIFGSLRAILDPEREANKTIMTVLKDEQVEVYQDLAKDRSLRKQLIISLPNTEMLRLYTTNKATYQQMSRMLIDYEEDNYNFDGYKIITDVDQPRTLENGTKVYRFWFMKIKREKASRRGVDFPIGIGIGIGGGHHHHGPWIGVGW